MNFEKINKSKKQPISEIKNCLLQKKDEWYKLIAAMYIKLSMKEAMVNLR